eukprot:105566_1
MINNDHKLISLILTHPLLSHYDVKQHKEVWHRLVEELEITNILNECLSINCKNKINYLLKYLMQNTTMITKDNFFWKQVGHSINKSSHLTSIIVLHPLLLQDIHSETKEEQIDIAKNSNSNKSANLFSISVEFLLERSKTKRTMLHRLVEELEISELLNIYFSFDTKNKIHQLLSKLKAVNHNIFHNNLFWKQMCCIINKSQKIISLISKHPLLSEFIQNVSEDYSVSNKFVQLVNYNYCKKKTIQQRLTKDLGVHLISDNIILNAKKQHAWKMCKDGSKNCIYLKILLEKCNNIEYGNNSNSYNGIYFDESLNHCLRFHKTYHTSESECRNASKCKYKNVLGSDPYIQLHRQFYHNITIDTGNSEQKNEIFKENIQYTKCSNYEPTLEFGSPFTIVSATDAKFKNMKQEFLQNEYHVLEKNKWNEELRKAVLYSKQQQAKKQHLNVKHMTALIFYINFDNLSEQLRMCYRKYDHFERVKKQKNFYHWNRLLENACQKAPGRRINKLYHGIKGQAISSTTLSATYYGPVSLLREFRFVSPSANLGTDDTILELHTTNGLCVDWFNSKYQYYDSDEFLYMNSTFRISNVYYSSKFNKKISVTGYDSLLPKENAMFARMLKCMSMAMETINFDSQMISLNDEEKHSDISNFSQLKSYAKLYVLYSLFLQYNPEIWKKIGKVHDIKCRDALILFVQNIRFASMQNMSKLLEMFFYSKLLEYNTTILEGNEIEDMLNMYKPKQPFYFSTIIKLFPFVQQVVIDKNNFDWSLNKFIYFLNRYDFCHIRLQDIYIAHIDETNAQQNLNHQCWRNNISTLNRLGWIFVTPIHLHRFGFEPLPQLPFLSTFVDFHKICWQKLVINDCVSSPAADNDQQEKKIDVKKVKDEIKNDEWQCFFVDHNPKNCVLSIDVFNKLKYSESLMEMLKWRKLNCDNMQKANISAEYYNFNDGCLNVECLVLDPLPNELYDIFYNNYKKQNQMGHVVSLEIILMIFPNLNELFLKSTTFGLRQCDNFIDFVNRYKMTDGVGLTLQTIFFSVNNPMVGYYTEQVEIKLKAIGWDFDQSQQMICKNQFFANEEIHNSAH